jgi:hypothetical protein
VSRLTLRPVERRRPSWDTERFPGIYEICVGAEVVVPTVFAEGADDGADEEVSSGDLVGLE